MVKMSATYTGGLHCELQHGPSGSSIETDAPKDNHGRGERFSPTDLMGASLASCILTTMAIFAERDGVKLEGARVEIGKEMIANPRRVASLKSTVTLPKSIPADYRKKLEQAALACPVKKSIHPEIDASIEFVYE